MSKQKIVIELNMPDAKSRSQAMALAVKVDAGVSSTAITGDSKDRLEVSGEGIDAARLAMCLRKKLRRPNKILSVEVKDKKKQEEEQRKKEQEEEAKVLERWRDRYVYGGHHYWPPAPQPPIAGHYCGEEYPSTGCHIM